MKKIIDKAIRGGWDVTPFLPHPICTNVDSNRAEKLFWNLINQQKDRIIFSYEFLKAYFGDKYDYFEKYDKEGVLHGELLWQYHAQQLVLAEDRIEYLRRFL